MQNWANKTLGDHVGSFLSVVPVSAYSALTLFFTGFLGFAQK